MKKFKKLLIKSIDDGQLITLGLSFLIAFTFFHYQKQLKIFQKIHLVGNGTYTCFNRTLQSYTAKLLEGGQSQYLQKNFFENTEDCYNELLQVLEGNFKVSLKDALIKTNNLVIKVNEFHRKLEVPLENQGEGNSYRLLLKSKFMELEDSLYFIDERVEGYKNSLEKTISNIYTFFLSLLTLFLYFEALNFFRKKKSAKLNEQIEKQAKEILENQNDLVLGLVGDLVKESLEQNNLFHCSKLMAKIQAKTSEKAPIPPYAISLGEKHEAERTYQGQVFDQSSSSDEGKILSFDLKQNNLHGQENERPVLESVNLGTALNNVISILADKLFTHGVILDVDIIQNENIFVLAQPEAVEQVFYNIILNSIQACASKTEEKKIFIKTKKLGPTIQVQISDTGAGLSQRFLEGLNEFNDAVAPLGIGLTICQQFMDEFKGRIRFSNEVNSKGKVVGARVSLFFNETVDSKEENLRSLKTPKQGKQVVSVVKGKKKEILQELKNTSMP